MELKLTPRFLQNGQRFFGPGVAELLERVREHRSLRAAAASMEMFYPQLGVKLCSMAGGGVQKIYMVFFKRTVPAGQVRQ